MTINLRHWPVNFSEKKLNLHHASTKHAAGISNCYWKFQKISSAMYFGWDTAACVLGMGLTTGLQCFQNALFEISTLLFVWVYITLSLIIKYSKSLKNVKLWQFSRNNTKFTMFLILNKTLIIQIKYMIISIVDKKKIIRHTLLEWNTDWINFKFPENWRRFITVDPVINDPAINDLLSPTPFFSCTGHFSIVN